MKRTLPLSCFFILLLTTTRLLAQNPTAPALGFNVFAQSGANFIGGSSQGAVAAGGDLTVAGNYAISTTSPGTFTVAGIPTSLVVGGAVNYTGGIVTVNNNGYVKVGNCSGSTVWYTDMSGLYSPMNITAGSDYSSAPSVQMQMSSYAIGVSPTSNPVCQTSGIDFATAFLQLQSSSTTMAALTDNSTLTDASGTLLPVHTGLPSAVRIALHSGTNVLNLAGADLNAVTSFTYNTAPDASHVLVVNVNAPGSFTWNTFTNSGIDITGCPYVLYNFYNATSININGSASIEGTLFCPYADVTKTTCPAPIEGQIICHSYSHSSGDDHDCCFGGSIPGCGGGVGVTTNFDVNIDNQCLADNYFVFMGNVTGVGPFSYRWDFGDGGHAYTIDAAHSYTATGTYNVKFVAIGAGGAADSITHSVIVSPSPTTGFTVNDSVQVLTGNSFAFTSLGSGCTYSWDFGDGTTGTGPDPVKTYGAVGGYVVEETVTSGAGCVMHSYMKVFVICDSVSCGCTGGLESVSLGDLVSRRAINNIKNSVSTKPDYNAMPAFTKNTHSSEARTTSSGSSISRFAPASLANTTPKVSSPTDITTLTSAVDAFSVDYVNNNAAKAAVLAITTLHNAYNHTKSICDRFRGATLQATEIVQIQGINFIQFRLLQQNGSVEYCIAFAAGKSNGATHFDLQSKWLISEYTGDDSVFNFQVWAASPLNTQTLTNEILTNLKAVLPVQQVDAGFILPTTYIAAGKRDKGFLDLNITSAVNSTNCKIIFIEQKNEQSGTDTLEIPFTLIGGVPNNFKIPIYDGYQYEGHLYMNDTLLDDVYMADGNWSQDLDVHYTSVTCKPNNNYSRVYTDGEYPLYRNFTVTGTSSDYISIYKFVTSGEDKVDLTNYHSFKFLAKGGGKVQIRLIKDGIVNFNDQYYTTLTLDTGTQNYQVSLNDFASDNSSYSTYINPFDVTAVVYTFQYGGKSTAVNFFVDDQAFSPTVVTGTRIITSNKLTIMPNPVSGPFQCQFSATQNEDLTLELTDLSGRVVCKQAVQAVAGPNTVTVNVPAGSGEGMFFVRLGNSSVKYDVTKITIVR
jgi:choice-of-anchor A domain-containing protein